MKKILSAALILAVTLGVAASDHIIFRDGSEKEVKLFQINDEMITYRELYGNHNELQVSSKEVYMVYIEKQGNVYFTKDGNRLTGENERVNAKKLDAIYLVKGAEIGASSIRVTENDIFYVSKSKSKGFGGLVGKGDSKEFTLPKSDVFMIRYKSGMRDIITPIDAVEEVKDTIPVQEEPKKPEFVVVFHSVVRGENLQTISQKYSVTVEQIKEWNDLSKATKATTALKTGTQLMIYQPKK